MSAEETIVDLATYNLWRRGEETIEMPSPSEIGATIDEAVNLLRKHDDLERELAAERVRAKLWEDKCHELIAPHYILDPCLRAHRFREALQFHPVLNNNPTPFWKKYGGPNDT